MKLTKKNNYTVAINKTKKQLIIYYLQLKALNKVS